VLTDIWYAHCTVLYRRCNINYLPPTNLPPVTET
jgi:hypothetical protein